MTHEDKELLLKDLCARLPYYVKCQMEDDFIINDSPLYDYILSEKHLELFRNHKGFYIRPYLRPMSSMTLEEHRDWMKYCKADYDCEFQPEPTFDFESCILSINWLNQHHFDYNNLIEKGLAIEVNKNNNPYKE